MSENKTPKPLLKPLFLIKPQSITPRDIRRAEKETGIVIVECESPEDARLLERPIDADIDAQASAALALMRYIIEETTSYGQSFNGAMLIRWFTSALIEQTKPRAVQRVKK